MKTINLSNPERIVSVAIGSVLAATGISKFQKNPVTALVKLVAGIYLMRRGASGYCDFNGSLGINTAGMSIGEAINQYASLNKSYDSADPRNSDQAY